MTAAHPARATVPTATAAAAARQEGGQWHAVKLLVLLVIVIALAVGKEQTGRQDRRWRWRAGVSATTATALRVALLRVGALRRAALLLRLQSVQSGRARLLTLLLSGARALLLLPLQSLGHGLVIALLRGPRARSLGLRHTQQKTPAKNQERWGRHGRRLSGREGARWTRVGEEPAAVCWGGLVGPRMRCSLAAPCPPHAATAPTGAPRRGGP
mmetsp:Transcript_6619/g.20008  ORF Transcript_6619/g.20008 Transcript_6619/m.20008 type:complete len:213 (-) Transcript_6619:45-683(-)